MRLRIVWAALIVIGLFLAGMAGFLTHFKLSALEDPGHAETSVANWGRHFLVKRASRENIPAPPEDRKASLAQGDVLYGIDCSMCHGRDGHGQTDMGRWMYPRAADLASAEVQSYSDWELFWIVKNGIRLSGMPAFGKVETDTHIWNLVDYVRSISPHSQEKEQTKTVK